MRCYKGDYKNMKEKKEVSESIKFLKTIISDEPQKTESKEKSRENKLQSYLGNWKENKILILTDNVQNANKLIERDAFDGNMIINVDIKRPVDLALDIIRFNSAQDGDLASISLIKNNYGANLIESILRKIGKWTFCPEESICRKTLIEILNSINLLRLNPNDKFKDSAKGTDYIAKKNSELEKLCEEYEKELKDRKLYDEASAYIEATNIINNNKIDICNIIGKDTIIKTMFFEDDRPILQDEFIEKLFKDNKVESINVNEITQGGNCHFVFKKCYGIFTEVYEVLKDIEAKKIKFGNVALLYTDETYVKYIKMLFAENDINVNVLSGYSALFNDYLKLIIDILKFAKNDFLYKDLKKVVFNRLIKDSVDYDEKIKEGEKDNEEDNTEGVDDKKLEDDKREKIKKYNNEHLKIAYISNIEKLSFYLKQYEKFVIEEKENFNYFTVFLTDLIEVFKTEINSKKINVMQLYIKLLNFSDKWTTNRDKEKNIIKIKLKELTKNIELYGEVNEFNKALDILIEELSIISFSDEEKDDEIIATKFTGYKIINRKNIYIMGLAAKYNVNGTESPILLDEERRKYYDYDNEKPKGHSVQLKSLSPIKNADDLLKTIKAFRDAKVNISAPFYDILDNINLAESPLYVNLLQEFGNGKDERIEKYPNIIDREYAFDNDRWFKEQKIKESS